MSAEHFVTLWCDHPGCLEFIEPGMQRAREAREDARTAGWRTRGSKDYCPEHATKDVLP